MVKQQGLFGLDSLKDSIAVVTGAGNYGNDGGICLHAAKALCMHVVILDLHLSID